MLLGQTSHTFLIQSLSDSTSIWTTIAHKSTSNITIIYHMWLLQEYSLLVIFIGIPSSGILSTYFYIKCDLLVEVKFDFLSAAKTASDAKTWSASWWWRSASFAATWSWPGKPSDSTRRRCSNSAASMSRRCSVTSQTSSTSPKDF